MSQEAAVRPSVKSTYKLLSSAISNYWSERAGSEDPFLIDALHGSPRFTQWSKTDGGFRIWSTDEALSVTVSPDKIWTTKGIRAYDIQSGLPAQTLYNAIQTAQAIVFTRISQGDTGEEGWFEEGEVFAGGADLDAALVDTPSEPITDDDAELIEDVCHETVSPTPDQTISVDTEKYDPQRIYGMETPPESPLVEQKPEGFTAQANRKNASTDGVICSYCGNLNQSAYKGTCPKCPKNSVLKQPPKPWPAPAKVAPSASSLKSLQGRILTIIDGSFADKTQREAVKTLINKEFRRDIGKVTE